MRRAAWTLERDDVTAGGVVRQVMGTGGSTVDVLVQTPAGLVCRSLDRLSAVEIHAHAPEQKHRPEEAT